MNTCCLILLGCNVIFCCVLGSFTVFTFLSMLTIIDMRNNLCYYMLKNKGLWSLMEITTTTLFEFCPEDVMDFNGVMTAINPIQQSGIQWYIGWLFAGSYICFYTACVLIFIMCLGKLFHPLNTTNVFYLIFQYSNPVVRFFVTMLILLDMNHRRIIPYFAIGFGLLYVSYVNSSIIQRGVQHIGIWLPPPLPPAPVLR